MRALVVLVGLVATACSTVPVVTHPTTTTRYLPIPPFTLPAPGDETTTTVPTGPCTTAIRAPSGAVYPPSCAIRP